jgi:hypothetical protein
MPSLSSSATAGAVPPPLADEALAAIRSHLERIRFGSIAITVHEGRVVQLDVTEKTRLGR